METSKIPFKKGPLSSQEVEERSAVATKMGLEAIMQVTIRIRILESSGCLRLHNGLK